MKKWWGKAAGFLLVFSLLVTAWPQKAAALTNDTQLIEVEWESPVAVIGVEQQEEQFILSAGTPSGRVANFYFSFPKDGGVRFHADEEGYFRPEALQTIQYSGEEYEDGEKAVVMEAGDTVVRLYIESSPWRFEVYNSEGELTVSYSADRIGLGYDEENALRKVKIASGLAENEVMFGLGERFSGFIQNGKTVEMWNTDSFTQLQKSYGDHNVGYKNIPLLHSSAGYSVFHNNTYYGIVDVGESDPQEYSFEFYGPILDLYIWTGEPAENIDRYLELTGNTVLVPKWALSYWAGQSSSVWLEEGSDVDTVRETVFSRLDRYEEMGTPIRNIFAEGIAAKTELLPVVEEMHERGIHCFGWMDSTWRTFDTVEAKNVGDFAQWDDNLDPIVMWRDSPRARWWASDGANWVDYTDPLAVDWLEGRFGAFLGNGLYGMMVDYNDSLPVETYYPGNGGTGDWMHNFSAYYYDKAVDEVFREYYGEGEYINFARAACAGSQHYAAAFGGDQSSTFLGLRQSVSALLSGAASGINIWGSDIGGLGSNDDTQKHNPEVYARWLAFGTFSPLMRAHGQTGWRDPWEYDSEELFQKYYWTRESLVDLIYSGTIMASLENIPMTQAMAVAYPGEPELAANESQYLFCGSLLVSPVTEEGATSQLVQFPEGRWVDLWDGTVYEGGTAAEVSAPLDVIPVFIRAGAAFPVTLGEELDIGSQNTGDANVSALLVTPAVEETENKLYVSKEETETFVCGVAGDNTYRVEAGQEDSPRIVVAMGAVSDAVWVDGEAYSELSQKPDSQAVETGFYRDLENNATIIVTEGSWSQILYTDSGERLVNLAQGCAATAEGIEAEKAAESQLVTDGDYTAAFAFAQENNAEGSLVLDLGQEETVNRILLKWGSTYGESYRLEASADGQDWQLLWEKDKGSGGTDTVRLETPGAYRYLRVSGVESSGKLDASLVEMEVYSPFPGEIEQDGMTVETEENGQGEAQRLSGWRLAAALGAAVLGLAAVALLVYILRGRKKKARR